MALNGDEIQGGADTCQKTPYERFTAALNGLPYPALLTIVAHRWEGRSYAQIAEALNVDQATVENYMLLALAAVKAALQESSTSDALPLHMQELPEPIK